MKISLKNIILIIVFVLVGIIHVLPHAIFSSFSLSRGIYYPMNFSELAYASQVKELTEGHISIGDSQIFEHKNIFPPIHPYVPIFILAVISFVSGSLANAFLISDLIFPSTIFLIIYLFSKKITKNTEFSIFNGLSTVFLYSITTNFPPITPHLLNQFVKKLLITDITMPLSFARTPNPQMSIIILLIPLLTLYFFILKPTLKKILIITIFGSLLFSTYFYHATFFYIVLCFVFLWSLFKKQLSHSKSLFCCLLVLTVVAIIYKHLSSQVPYSYSQIFAGYFKTRYFDWIFSLRYLAVFVIIYLLSKLRNQALLIFSSAIILSAIVCMNFQLFSGWTIVSGHWPQTTIEPVILLITLIVIHQFLTKKISLNKLYIVFSILILVHAFIFQLKFSDKYKNNSITPKDNISAIMWLKDHANKNSVVLSLDVEKFETYVTVLTSANNYIPIYAYHYAPIDEIWLRNLYAYKIYSLDIQNIKFESLKPAVYSLADAYNTNKYKHYSEDEYSQEFIVRMQNCFPSICSGYYVIPKSSESYYKSAYQNLSLKNMPYKLDYVIYGDYERILGASPPKGEIVFTSGNTSIFKIPEYLH